MSHTSAGEAGAALPEARFGRPARDDDSEEAPDGRAFHPRARGGRELIGGFTPDSR